MARVEEPFHLEVNVKVRVQVRVKLKVRVEVEVSVEVEVRVEMETSSPPPISAQYLHNLIPAARYTTYNIQCRWWKGRQRFRLTCRQWKEA